MTRKARLGLYLEDGEIKKQIKIAAARRGMSATAYCAEAIRERLRKDGETSDGVERGRRAFLARMDKLRQEIGPMGTTTAELVEEGRGR
ncbi:MAG: hypothetical protein HY670_09285 [Chloroflexi bacterium]|nr:hypothetical protein [Chloroflexota bacterium]